MRILFFHAIAKGRPSKEEVDGRDTYDGCRG